MHLTTCSPEETLELGVKMGRALRLGQTVALFGELGAGKTTLIKGIVSGAAGISVDEVSSPTFTYLHIYEGERTVYHFDLYRLADEEAFLSMGFEEYFHADGICCVEWAERIPHALPEGVIRVEVDHGAENKRELEIDGLTQF